MTVNNQFYIDCRQSGKTTKLVNEFIDSVQEGKEVFFFCSNRAMCDNVKRLVQSKLDGSQRSLGRFDVVNMNRWIRTPTHDLLLRQPHVKDEESHRVFVDEYFFFTEEQKKLLHSMFTGCLRKAEWVVRTTSNKFYRRDVLDLVKHVKEHKFPLSKVLPFISDEDMEAINEMNYLLISEPSFRIIARQLEMEKHMSRDQFEIEMLGRFLRNKDEFGEDEKIQNYEDEEEFLKD